MYLKPWAAVTLKTTLPAEQVQQRLANQVDDRTVYWWWEAQPRPYVGSVGPTHFHLERNSVFAQSRWMPITISGYIGVQAAGSLVQLEFRTESSRFGPVGLVLATATAGIFLCSLMNGVPEAIATLLITAIVFLGLPYLLFVLIFGSEVDVQKEFLRDLLAAQELKAPDPV